MTTLRFLSNLRRLTASLISASIWRLTAFLALGRLKPTTATPSRLPSRYSNPTVAPGEWIKMEFYFHQSCSTPVTTINCTHRNCRYFHIYMERPHLPSSVEANRFWVAMGDGEGNKCNVDSREFEWILANRWQQRVSVLEGNISDVKPVIWHPRELVKLVVLRPTMHRRAIARSELCIVVGNCFYRNLMSSSMTFSAEHSLEQSAILVYVTIINTGPYWIGRHRIFVIYTSYYILVFDRLIRVTMTLSLTFKDKMS